MAKKWIPNFGINGDTFIPIVLNQFGAKLVPYHRSGDGLTDDSSIPLKGAVGIHDTCGDVITVAPVSKTHIAFRCGCGLYEPFPKGIKTYKQAQVHFRKFLLM